MGRYILIICCFLLAACSSQPDLVYPTKTSASESQTLTATEQDTQPTQNEVPTVEAPVSSEAQEEALVAKSESSPSDKEVKEKLDEIQSKLEVIEYRQKEIQDQTKALREEAAKAREEKQKQQALLASMKEKEKEKEQQAQAASPKSENELYYLRIISLDGYEYYRDMANNIVDFLKEQGIENAVARMSGEYWVVDIGGYDSMRSAAAKAVETRIKNMEYQGSQQFGDAYFINY